MVEEDKFNQLKEEFIKINEAMQRLRGNDPILGKIYALILLSPKPITQEEIANETGYSRSQISRLLKNLENHMFIITRNQPGSREKLYEGHEKSFFDNFMRVFDLSRKLLSEKSDILDDILKEYNNLSDKIKKTPEAEKFEEVVTVFYSMFDAYVEILDEFIEKFENKFKDFRF